MLMEEEETVDGLLSSLLVKPVLEEIMSLKEVVRAN